MNTPQLCTALRERFSAPEYALMFEVRSGTGHSGSVRYADAIAMGLWPSRGLDLTGFEIKASRSDWLRELKEPQKADRIAIYCDRWYVVAGDKDIVLPGELPTAWGLIVPRGEKLMIVKEAPPLPDPKPVTRLFLASLLRSSCVQSAPELEVADRISKAVAEQAARSKIAMEKSLANTQHLLNELQQVVAQFESTSGLAIRSWRGEKVGPAVRFVLDGGLNGIGNRIRALGNTAQDISNHAKQSADSADEFAREHATTSKHGDLNESHY